MAREVPASAEVDARTQASQMVRQHGRQHGRRHAEELAWEYSDRSKANEDKPRYEAWQAVIRNIVDHTEHPPQPDEQRVPIDHGTAEPELPVRVDPRVPPGMVVEMHGEKIVGSIKNLG